MNRPLVSILIPAYNVEKYIRQCLDSVVGQTCDNLQVVIVNDGSTDNTGEISDEYASKYSFIEVYHIPNGGVANARNVLLSKIKGEYALFVDADDWIEPDTIELLLNVALDNRLDVVVYHAVVENGCGGCKALSTNTLSAIWNREEAIKKFLLHKELNGSLWNKLVKTSLFHNLSFDSEISYGEDALFFWQVLQRVDKLGINPSRLYHYRMNNDSISHQPFGIKKMTGHKVWQIFADETKRLYPQFSDLARGNFGVSDIFLLYSAVLDNYPKDTNIKTYQKNVRKNIGRIFRLKLVPFPKFCAAILLSHAYVLSKCVIGIYLKVKNLYE